MTRRWFLLAGAVVAEVFGTMALRASVESPWYVPGVVVGYLVAFYLLGRALGHGIPIGVAYGIWAAAGVALVAILGGILFGETLSLTAIIGLMIIIAGVFIVQTGQRDPVAKEILES